MNRVRMRRWGKRGRYEQGKNRVGEEREVDMTRVRMRRWGKRGRYDQSKNEEVGKKNDMNRVRMRRWEREVDMNRVRRNWEKKILLFVCLNFMEYQPLSSSSYRAGSTDIPDPLSPLLPIVHRPR